MTKAHYAKIAAVIAGNRITLAPSDEHCETYAQGWNDACEQIAMHLAAALRGSNPNYDEARFLAACGVEP